MPKVLFKSCYVFIALLLLSSSLYAQVGKLRNVLNQSDLVNYRLVGETSKDTFCIPNGSKVYITLASGKIWVDPWQIVANGVCTSTTPRTLPLTPNTLRQQRLELQPVVVSYGTPITTLKLPFGAWVYGLSAIPFRVRLKQEYDNNGNLTGTASSTNFALALYGGHTLWGRSTITNRAIHNNAISLIAFAGPSTVDISKEINAPAALPIKNKVNATIVYGTGITFSRNALGATIYFGLENALGTGASLWTFNGKPFIGFGVSTGFMR
jgi:hypothetical protein